jgi:hypothetical protein
MRMPLHVAADCIAGSSFLAVGTIPFAVGVGSLAVGMGLLAVGMKPLAVGVGILRFRGGVEDQRAWHSDLAQFMRIGCQGRFHHSRSGVRGKRRGSFGIGLRVLYAGFNFVPNDEANDVGVVEVFCATPHTHEGGAKSRWTAVGL